MGSRNSKGKAVGRGAPPNTVSGTVPPRRTNNLNRRPREYLTIKEIDLLRKAARERGGRYGHRDATMVLVAYRHGLRAAELCKLRLDQFDLAHGLLHVRRLKHGMPSVHPLGGSEIRDLRRLRREQIESRHVFLTERRAPISPAGFRKLLARIGEAGNFPFPRRGIFRFQCIPICCGTRAGISWRATGGTRGQYNTNSDTGTSSTPFGTRSCRRSGSVVL